MKKVLLTIWLLGSFVFLKAQSFTLQLGQDTLHIGMGQTDTVSLGVIPSGGFSASVFLSVESFPTALPAISPSILNAPYTNCYVTVPTSNLNIGIHRLVIKGEQGALIAYDTCYVAVTFDPALKWFQFKRENSGLVSNVNAVIAIDRNGDVWTSSSPFTTAEKGVAKYDHTNWYQWVNTTYTRTDFLGNVLSQQPNMIFTDTTSVLFSTAIACDSANNKWIGTSNGLVKFSDPGYTTLFPGEVITAVETYNDKICVGTSGNGVHYFNGSSWITYTTANSYLPNNEIHCIAMENDTNLWLGTNGGLAHFDTHFWAVYNPSNSIISHNYITSVTVDGAHNKWVAALGTGLIKFDNATWQQFTPPCVEISAICADHANNIWLGFQSGEVTNGLVKYDGTSFTLYNSSNSGFSSDPSTPGYGRISSIKEDPYGVLWIATFGDGVFAYKEEGISQVLPSFLVTGMHSIPVKTSASTEIFPNPGNGNFTFRSQLFLDESCTVIVSDLQGRAVYSNSFQGNGTAMRNFSLDGVTPGIYLVSIFTNNSSETCKLVISGK
ncbi:MAG: two component regulator propeller domain protein [Bacteroidetes bacterium]|nr:two component regulator propeller domain protein [Bacteroidota bacterium]